MIQKTNSLGQSKINFNLNFIDKQGIIHSVYVGDQTGAKFLVAAKELKELIDQLRRQGKPVLVLTDLTKMGKVNLAVRREGIEVMRKYDVDKAGIFGGDFATRSMVNIMLQVSGMGFKMKFFETKAEALSWLKEPYR